MTFLFHDGCGDTRRTTDLYEDTTRYLTAASGGSSGFTGFTTGLFGGTNTYAAINGTITTALLAEAPTTSFIGVRVQTKSTGNNVIIELLSGLSTLQCFLRSTADGTGGVKYQVCRGTSGSPTVLVQSAGYAIDGGTVWRYVQFSVTLATDSTGSAGIIVDDDAEVTASSIVTSNSGTTTDRIEVTASGTNYLDDIYWCSDQGAAPYNTYLGQYVIEGVFPNADGTTTDWTPSAGDNYTCVDDGATSDVDDTTYVSTTIAATGVTETYGFGALEVITGGILAVEATGFFRLETTGSETLEWVIRTGGSETSSTAMTVDSTGYQGKGGRWIDNPVDSADWDVADIDGGEFGWVKTVA